MFNATTAGAATVGLVAAMTYMLRITLGIGSVIILSSKWLLS